MWNGESQCLTNCNVAPQQILTGILGFDLQLAHRTCLLPWAQRTCYWSRPPACSQQSSPKDNRFQKRRQLLVCRVLGKVAVTGQTAFRETTLVALLRLGLDVMIS
jgi:hypothetical protein